MPDPPQQEAPPWRSTALAWLQAQNNNYSEAWSIWREPNGIKVSGLKGTLIQDRALNSQPGKSIFLVQEFEAERPAFIVGELVEWALPTLPQDQTPTTAGVYPLSDDQARQYEEIVAVALAKLVDQKLDKVVLSADTPHDRPLSPLEVVGLFDRLMAAHPMAFVHLTMYEGRVWVGASPEVILARDGQGLLQTMALAGTHTAPGLPWTDKEISEHESVSSYIRQALESQGVNLEVTGPREVGAGGLYHLRTDFEIRQKLTSTRALEMVEALHPTPALSGSPVSTSKDLILQLEGRRRGLYAGMIGPVSLHGQPSEALFANLRCASWEIATGQLTLWAGAGLNSRSIPQQERREIEAKLYVVGQHLTDTSGNGDLIRYSTDDSAENRPVTAATDEAASA